MRTRSPHRARCAALATAALPLIAAAACSSGTAASTAQGTSTTQRWQRQRPQGSGPAGR